jgi:hypothetical protein
MLQSSFSDVPPGTDSRGFGVAPGPGGLFLNLAAGPGGVHGAKEHGAPLQLIPRTGQTKAIHPLRQIGTSSHFVLSGFSFNSQVS